MKLSKEVDWSKAPEGATHYNVKCVCPWLKETPASYFAEDKKVWVKYNSNAFAMYDLRNAVKRPQEWGGSGVPPVGTVCEYLKSANYRTTWIKVKVVFIGRNLIFFEHGVNGNEFTEQITEVSFRPIKTPEQIAAEERLHAIDEMVDLAQRSDSIFKDLKTITALYDAGYRKTEV